jgi:hypothetical protein
MHQEVTHTTQQALVASAGQAAAKSMPLYACVCVMVQQQTQLSKQHCKVKRLLEQ